MKAGSGASQLPDGWILPVLHSGSGRSPQKAAGLELLTVHSGKQTPVSLLEHHRVPSGALRNLSGETPDTPRQLMHPH